MTAPKILPTTQPNVSRLASDTDKLTVLTRLLAAYPNRAPSDFRLIKPAYLQALEGISQWALFEAERRINQNALGHAFMPSPAELRGEIDRVMEPFRERERRAAEEERRYAWEEGPAVRHDEASRARILEGFRKLRERYPGLTRTRPPPKPRQQIPDYSQERIEITDALRRTLNGKGAVNIKQSPANQIEGGHHGNPKKSC